MEFRILGSLEVVDDGQMLDVGGAKQRALLAVLLLHANEVVSTDRLVDALWEEDPPARAQKALQVYVSQLRKVLGRERIETREPGYMLHVAGEELDLARFELLLEEGKPKEALALWRGEPLSDFAYSRFAEGEIARLEDLHLAAVGDRIDADLQAGRHAALVGELEALVREHPLRERLRGQLMLALYRSGRQAEALDAYQDARRALTEELGIEPGRELREMEKTILLQDPALDLRVVHREPEAVRGTVFVGRDAEVEQLVSALTDALAGRGRVALIAGEPGIGKSRLCDEVAGQARSRGAHVLVGRCWEAGGAPAYWPWVQALRTYMRDSDADAVRDQIGAGASEIVHVLPELRSLFPGLEDSPAVETESARFRLFDATASFLTRAADSQPIVLVLDDLHAADTPSLLMLEFLAGEIVTSRILVLAAYRDVDPTLQEPLAATLASLGRQAVTMRLALEGLAETDVATFIELSEGVAPPEALIEAIHDETDGNPLFVGEVVRLLSQEGLLDGGRDDVDRIGVPQGVREVIGRRLGHLSARCRQLLTLAAILGREFDLVALEQVSGSRLDQLLDALDEAMSTRVVGEVPGSPGRLRFAHALIRDTIYEELTPARRIGLHRLAGEALEALYAQDLETHLAEVAHHFFDAAPGGEVERAVDFSRRAADHALRLLAYEESARLYDQALNALALKQPVDLVVRCELLIALGGANSRAGNTVAAKAAAHEAADLARRLGLPTKLAEAAAEYGGRIMWVRAGGDDQLVPLLEEGLHALGSEDEALRVRLLARLAGALRDEHSRERRDMLSAEAVALARRIENPVVLGYALAGRGHAIIAPDTVEECFAIGTELHELAERSRDLERVIAGHALRMLAQVMTGDLAAAESEHEEQRRRADELRQPVQLWNSFADGGMLALARGRFAEAEELMAEARALEERVLPYGAQPIFQLQRSTLAEFRDGLEEVEPAIAELARVYPARPVFRCALLHVHAQIGRWDDARRELAALTVDGFHGVPFDQEWLLAMGFVAEASALLEDTDAASALYQLILPWAGFNAVDVAEGFRGSISRHLGLLAGLLGRFDDAAQHFEHALELNDRMQVRPWLAYTQEEFGRMLISGGQEERGRELIEQALATYRELGMGRPLARAAALSEV